MTLKMQKYKHEEIINNGTARYCDGHGHEHGILYSCHFYSNTLKNKLAEDAEHLRIHGYKLIETVYVPCNKQHLKWISVFERYPKYTKQNKMGNYFTPVLIQYNSAIDSKPSIAYAEFHVDDEGKAHFNHEFCWVLEYKNVTHWMSLPEPCV